MNKKAKIFAEPIWIVISVVAIIILGMFVQKSYDIFSITGNELIARGMPSSANLGSTFTVTYQASSVSGNWGVSIEDKITGGCYFISSGTDTLKTVMLSTGSNPESFQVRAPSSGATCTFSGNYMFGNKPIKNIPDFTISISSTSTCTQGQIRCASATQYQTCLANGLWSGSLSCSSGVCSNNACTTITPTCNTISDTNCDGVVDRTELGVSISSWISGTLSRDKLGEVIMAWIE
jgi:hypothetical protein